MSEIIEREKTASQSADVSVSPKMPIKHWLTRMLVIANAVIPILLGLYYVVDMSHESREKLSIVLEFLAFLFVTVDLYGDRILKAWDEGGKLGSETSENTIDILGEAATTIYTKLNMLSCFFSKTIYALHIMVPFVCNLYRVILCYLWCYDSIFTCSSRLI